MDLKQLSELDNQKQPIFMRPGHCAGDLVEAGRWKILAEQFGRVELDVHLPKQLLNPRGELFGGFTGTYVDMVSIWTVRTLFREQQGFTWASTINMRIDYLKPVTGPRFRLLGELIHDGRTTCLTATTFYSEADEKLVYAITTLRKFGASGGNDRED